MTVDHCVFSDKVFKIEFRCSKIGKIQIQVLKKQINNFLISLTNNCFNLSFSKIYINFLSALISVIDGYIAEPHHLQIIDQIPILLIHFNKTLLGELQSISFWGFGKFLFYPMQEKERNCINALVYGLLIKKKYRVIELQGFVARRCSLGIDAAHRSIYNS